MTANFLSHSHRSYMIDDSRVLLSFPTQGLLRVILFPRAWMVMTSAPNPGPNSLSNASLRSWTVLFVREIIRMREGSVPESTRCFTFPTRVVVFPVPAAAMTSSVSASSKTASDCWRSSLWPLTSIPLPGIRCAVRSLSSRSRKLP